MWGAQMIQQIEEYAALLAFSEGSRFYCSEHLLIATAKHWEPFRKWLHGRGVTLNMLHGELKEPTETPDKLPRPAFHHGTDNAADLLFELCCEGFSAMELLAEVGVARIDVRRFLLWSHMESWE